MSEKITEYQIVGGKNFDDLQKEVNKEIKRGWVPQGGINHTGPIYSQAMFR